MNHKPFGAYEPSGMVRWLIDRAGALPAETWSARRAALVLRHIVMHMTKGAPFDVKRLGVRMRLSPYTNICEKKVLFTPQFFDPEERAILAARMRDDFRFIDIGANVGAYSLFVAGQAGRAAHILAVEPQPDIFDRLAYNIALNPFGTVKAVACAVADKPGELTLFLDPRNSGESSVKILGSTQAEAIRVPAVTLLDLVRQEGFERVDAMKLDVEGAEDIILEPFFRLAPPQLHPALLIIEADSGQWQTDLPTLLGSNGYRLLATTRLNLVYERA